MCSIMAWCGRGTDEEAFAKTAWIQAAFHHGTYPGGNAAF